MEATVTPAGIPDPLNDSPTTNPLVFPTCSVLDPEATESRRFDLSIAMTEVPEVMPVPEIVSPATKLAADNTESLVDPEPKLVLSVVLSWRRLVMVVPEGMPVALNASPTTNPPEDAACNEVEPLDADSKRVVLSTDVDRRILPEAIPVPLMVSPKINPAVDPT